jgi:hypothetical protein
MLTPTLEDTIRELAARGEISDIGLSMNSTYTKWRASFTPCSKFGVSYAEDEDPVKALQLALTSAHLRKPRSGSPKAMAAEEARATGRIEQDTVDVSLEADAATAEVDAGIDALM